MEKQYRLVFKGELLAGFDPAEIRLRASQRLGASPAQIERLFSGQAVTLKRGLSIDAAARYARELRLLGMRMHVELDANPPPKADVAPGHCKIVFSGELAPGFAREQVIAAASERLHASAAQISLLFSGRKTTLKKGLGEEPARRYASRLQSIGMLVAVESDAPKEEKLPSAPIPGMPIRDQDVNFSHVETLIHSPLMQASERLQAESNAAPVDLDFTQTMVDNELVATNAQRVLPDMEKTELAGEAVLRAYMDDAPGEVLPPPVVPVIVKAPPVAAIAAPLVATAFVQAANVAPTAQQRVCISCGARQTHGRNCAHCGHEFPREFAPSKDVLTQLAATPAPVRAALPETVMVTAADAAQSEPARPNRVVYGALAAAMAGLGFALWRLLH